MTNSIKFSVLVILRCAKHVGTTQFIPNYKTFDFFDTKFDHSFYLKNYAKYHFFCRDLIY
jgi:hypothetical protein